MDFKELHFLKDVVLEDDNTPTGGTSYDGETLEDFLFETNMSFSKSNLTEVNEALKQCGIKKISARKYIIDVYNELRDFRNRFANGNDQLYEEDKFLLDKMLDILQSGFICLERGNNK